MSSTVYLVEITGETYQGGRIIEKWRQPRISRSNPKGIRRSERVRKGARIEKCKRVLGIYGEERLAEFMQGIHLLTISGTLAEDWELLPEETLTNSRFHRVRFQAYRGYDESKHVLGTVQVKVSPSDYSEVKKLILLHGGLHSHSLADRFCLKLRKTRAQVRTYGYARVQQTLKEALAEHLKTSSFGIGLSGIPASSKPVGVVKECAKGITLSTSTDYVSPVMKKPKRLPSAEQRTRKGFWGGAS